MHFLGTQQERYAETIRILKERCSSVSDSFNVLTRVTEGQDWNSLVAEDPYFADVELIEDREAFIMAIMGNRYLNGVEVARYILSRGSCTHLKLQKLTYMCYAEYLCRYGKKLYIDKNYAFEHGPGVDTVYARYRDDSGSHRGEKLSEDPETQLAFSSRITLSEDGYNKMDCIEYVLKEYGSCSGTKLRALTHRKETPWSFSYVPDKDYIEIPDEFIIKYHINETC